MTFETLQLRPCHWPTMGSTQPHHAARPKAVCSVHAGTHDPGCFRAHSGAVAFQTAHS
jgi:hypothetical protein